MATNFKWAFNEFVSMMGGKGPCDNVNRYATPFPFYCNDDPMSM
jgi:hypothetical protein